MTRKTLTNNHKSTNTAEFHNITMPSGQVLAIYPAKVEYSTPQIAYPAKGVGGSIPIGLYPYIRAHSQVINGS